MTSMRIRHAGGEYDIRFAALADELGRWLDELGHRQYLLVTDRNVATHQLSRLENALANVPRKDFPDFSNCPRVILEPGDENKNLRQLESIWDALATSGFRRDDLVIAFGGGVVGDMAGFAAASWMRGVDFFQLPTTLLAQVDASVGGKTAINHSAGKNLVGAFHQPRGVLIDPVLLDSLPEREYRAGIAEILKAALLAGADALESLETNLDGLLQRDASSLHQQVAMAIGLKKRLVEADERELSQRAFLNLGHTFAHAIEHALGYGRWLHGEAVAAGLVAACRSSEQAAALDPAITARVVAILQRCALPWQLPSEIPPRQLAALMGMDKKANRDGIRLVLLSAPGKPSVRTLDSRVDLADLLASLAAN